MKRNFLALKNRKPRVYVFLSIYVFLLFLIIAESSMPGGISGAQSGSITEFFANIVNVLEPKEESKIIEPLSIKLSDDSSYLPSIDGNPQIALGTTSLLTYTVSFPEKKGADIYDMKFDADGMAEGYSISLSSSMKNQEMSEYLRIIGEKVGEYSLNINCGGNIGLTQHFSVVDRPAPTEYRILNIPKTLKVGESHQLDVELYGSKNGAERNDKYLRRVFDQNLIEASSDGEGVRITSSGMIDALSEGEYTITYGSYSFPLSVLPNENLIKADSTTSLELISSNDSLHLRDYDYCDEDEYSFDDADPDLFYGSIIKAKFNGKIPSNRNVIFKSSDEMIARIVKTKFDEDGNPMAFVQGYREKGDVDIIVEPRDEGVQSEKIALNVVSANLEQFELNIGDVDEFDVNNGQKLEVAISNPNPKNASDLRLSASGYDEEYVMVSGINSNTLVFSFLKEGETQATIYSVDTPSLSKNINFRIKARGAINDSNIDNVHQFIRKSIGHFTLFLVTSIIGSIFFFFYFEKEKLLISFGLSNSIGLSIAMLSELIQHFIPSRFGSWADVGIDFVGYFAGALAMLGILCLIKYLVDKKHQPK